MLALTFLVLFLGNFLTTVKVVHQKIQKNQEKVQKTDWDTNSTRHLKFFHAASNFEATLAACETDPSTIGPGEGEEETAVSLSGFDSVAGPSLEYLEIRLLAF